VTSPAQRAWDRALFCGVLLWTFMCLCFPLWDTDFWWHLRTGELILAEGRIPQIDRYTYIDYNKPWIDLHWGFQVLITLVYRLGGVKLVTLTKAAVITSAVALGWAAGGRGLPAWLKAALWILPIICISGRGHERPEMLSLLFLAFWLWAATEVERRPALIWALPVVQLVWVNCHALFVLGLVVGAAYVADCVLREFAGGRLGLAPAARDPSARAIIWSAGLVAAACFANPYFEEGALFPLVLYRKFSVDQDFYSQMIGEFHRPIDFVREWGWRGVANIYLASEALLWCLAASSFLWLLWRRRRFSVMRLLLFAGFSHLAWKATRNTNIFALVAAVVSCENFGEALEATAVRADARRLLRRTWAAAAFVALLIAAVVTGVWNDIGKEKKPFGLGERPNWFMHEAAKFAGQPGFPTLAFVSNNGQAAVYEYHNAPQRLVFMDARLEVCTKQTFQVYNEILSRMAHIYVLGEPLYHTEESGQAAIPQTAGENGWSAGFETGVGERPALEVALQWPEILQQISGGEFPVVMLDNPFSAFQIMGLLRTPGWRLVFADSTGAVFLSDEQAEKLSLPRIDVPKVLEDSLRGIEGRYLEDKGKD
jgi:hypothetical protein